jgi:hypothetical protein
MIGVSEPTITVWFKERKSSEIKPPDSRQDFDIWTFATTDREGGGQQSYFGAAPTAHSSTRALRRTSSRPSRLPTNFSIAVANVLAQKPPAG